MIEEVLGMSSEKVSLLQELHVMLSHVIMGWLLTTLRWRILEDFKLYFPGLSLKCAFSFVIAYCYVHNLSQT